MDVQSAGSTAQSGRHREVAVRRRTIEVDGEPRLVLAGEVHYFRLPRGRWASALEDAREAGLDTIATYIPWIWHELPDGRIDLTGETVPERDVVGYLELCAEAGFDVIARPGPYVMAELKNEGIPFRVLRDTPSLRSRGWDGEPAASASVDLLAPAWLDAVREWYDAVLPVLADRQAPTGGPVIAVQLDNEVGMLDWVTNTPQLTDLALRGFAAWRHEHGLPRLDDATVRGGAAGTDAELALHHELGRWTRDRFAHYLGRLEGMVRDAGVRVPLLVNVHGTGMGRGLTFPIGVSQLAPAYRGRAEVIAGSDYYLGDLTVRNVADLYLSNAILASVNGPDQPASSLEFEAGSGDYGEDLSSLTPPEAVQLKTLLTLAQGSRAINYYLFSGGENPLIDLPRPDGTGRIAFTGQFHGFAAPIDPTGARTPGYPPIPDVLATVRDHEAFFAAGTEEHDGIDYGFVADHYLTEYAHPAAVERAAQREDVQRHRFGGMRDTFGTALVLGGWRFGAVDLQAAVRGDDADVGWTRGATLRLDRRRVLALPTGRSLGRGVQRVVADFVLAGGRLLLVGELPTRDDDGTPCTILADALGLADAGRGAERHDADGSWYPTVVPTPELPARAELRVAATQRLDLGRATGAVVLATERDTGHPVVAEVTAGSGRALVVGADLPAHLGWWTAAIERLGVRRGLTHDATEPGIVATTVRLDRPSGGEPGSGGGRLLVALNVAPYPLRPRFRLDGIDLGVVPLAARGHTVLELPG